MKWPLRFVCVLASTVAEGAVGQVLPRGDLPSPILTEQVTLLLEHAHADADQVATIRALHDQYRDHWRAEFGTKVAALRTLSVKTNGMIALTQPHVDGENTVSLLAKYRDEAAPLRALLAEANEEFWKQAGVILIESQRPQLELAQLDHRRMELQVRRGSIRERHIDLLGLYRPFLTPLSAPVPSQPDHAAWTILKLDAIESQKVGELLMEWNRDRVHGLDALLAAEKRSAQMKAEAIDILRSLRQPGLDPTERDLLTARARALQADAARIELPSSKRLVELNRLTLALIKDVLPALKQRVINRLYCEEAYPEVYPDTVAGDSIFAAAESMDDLTVEQRSLLREMHGAFQQEHDRLSEGMAKCVFERGLAEFVREPIDGAAISTQWERLARIGHEREALNLAQPATIRSALLPEQAARLCPHGTSGRTRRNVLGCAAANSLAPTPPSLPRT